jgi:hypothetical protein
MPWDSSAQTIKVSFGYDLAAAGRLDIEYFAGDSSLQEWHAACQEYHGLNKDRTTQFCAAMALRPPSPVQNFPRP